MTKNIYCWLNDPKTTDGASTLHRSLETFRKFIKAAAGEKFTVSQFDTSTYQVLGPTFVGTGKSKEWCVVSEFSGENTPAKYRAELIALALNIAFAFQND